MSRRVKIKIELEVEVDILEVRDHGDFYQPPETNYAVNHEGNAPVYKLFGNEIDTDNFMEELEDMIEVSVEEGDFEDA